MTAPSAGPAPLPPPPARRPPWRRAGRAGARVAVVLVLGLPLLVGASAAAALGLLLFGNLPGTVPEERPQVESIPSYVYDADGNEIGSFRQYDLALPMERDDVPQVLQDAVVAAEDRKFWSHRGIDPEGIVRAAWAIYEEGRVVQGGSTITQQYIRGLYLTPEVTVTRKLQEAILATRFERELAEELGSVRAAKEEILYRYLDSVYFGGGAYGAGAAAQTYFHKDVRDLTLSEAALLVGILPSPSAYAPRDDPDAAEAQRKVVLGAMLETGAITQAQHDEAVQQTVWYLAVAPAPDVPVTPVHPAPTSGATAYPYFVDYVYKYLTARYGEAQVLQGGLRVETTLDPRLQALAVDAVGRGLEGTDWPVEMSLVSVEPGTGHVKAFVAGRDHAQYQVNLALGGSQGMQAGSAFKVFTVAAALEAGFGPGTAYPGGPYTLPGCEDDASGCIPYSGGGGPMGPALASSSNNYFMRLVMDLGPDRVAEMAHRLGVSRITTDRDYYATLTLGADEVSPLDMAAAFATIANHGRAPGYAGPPPVEGATSAAVLTPAATPVLRVVAADGTVLEDNTDPPGDQVLNAAIADTTTAMMRGVVEDGTGTRAQIGRPAAGKTGTTDENRAVWFVGYTPQLSTAVWMGHADQPRPLGRIGGRAEVFGGDIPATAWARFMGPAMEGLPVVDFATPGPLPPPGAALPGSRAVGSARPLLQVAPDCGEPCIRQAPEPPPQTTTTTTTTTTAPPPPAPVPPAP